jgi:hypothetical protein
MRGILEYAESIAITVGATVAYGAAKGMSTPQWIGSIALSGLSGIFVGFLWQWVKKKRTDWK